MAQAGGANRRPDDDGGHYIAARFDGPTEAFNHFAQNTSFDRGGYRVLEDQWARAKRGGPAHHREDRAGIRRRITPTFDDQRLGSRSMVIPKARNFPTRVWRSGVENDESAQLLTEIGRLLMASNESPSAATLLYAKLDYNMVSPAIFEEHGNHLQYRDDLGRLADALLDLWETQETDDRWAEMEHVVRDGGFETSYTYPDAIDRDEDPFVRRDRIVERHFGAKPIVYPPCKDDDDSFDV